MAEQFGRYEILEEIGQGGFAIVYRGRDTTLDRVVALKELRSILLNDADWVKRFRREARTIARLDHPHIVTIHDIYEAKERLCIVMRLVDGPSLEELIATQGPLPWSEAVDIITAVAQGLDFAHSQDILHRDLKPANILIDPERGPMLTDFGLAKLASESSTSITAGGGVVGTPHYIAPEVWEGQGTTRQSDIYALGCILYEMLTGEKIFKGETPPAVMLAHFKPLALPTSWPKGVPCGVANVLQTALSNNPADRYDIAGEMIKALAGLIEGDQAQPSLVSGKTDLTVEEMPQNTGLREPSELDVAQTEPEPIPAERSSGKMEQVVSQSQPLSSADPVSTVSPEQLHMQGEMPDPAQIHAAHHAHLGAAPATAPTQSVSHSMPATHPRRRLGCWIVFAAVGGILLLTVVGVGSFCSAFGNNFGADFFQPVELGETVNQDISIPLPNSADTPDLKIDFAGGELSLSPGAERALVQGTATYNVPDLKPKVVVNDNQIHLQFEKDIGLGGLTTQGLENRWDLKLGSTPMALTVNAGGAQTNMELGGLSLTELKVSQGAASFALSFSEPNRVEMKTLGFDGGASSATLTGLANAQAKEVIFHGGAGDFTLDFSGQLQNDIEVRVKGGLGTVTIIVPENVRAELVIADDSTASVDAAGGWQKSGDTYTISGQGSQIIINAEFGFGSLKLRTS